MRQAILNKSRKDKFILVLDLPKALKGILLPEINDTYNADVIQFSCYGSPTPTISIPAIDVPYGGQVHKTTSNFRPPYEELNISFFLDNGWKNYFILFKWLNLFNDEKTAEIAMNYKFPDETYKGNFEKIPFRDLTTSFATFPLDEYNNKILKFTYTNVFITKLDRINFSHQDPSEISCNASFSFNQLYCNLIKNVDTPDC